ncbi:MAG: CRISPR-associated protein Cas5 [Candidatus Omnitrophica bacterium]|nr:CRISPR-associated protein Cas5 [Candidatus Omnitrophota bacterium]
MRLKSSGGSFGAGFTAGFRRSWANPPPQTVRRYGRAAENVRPEILLKRPKCFQPDLLKNVRTSQRSSHTPLPDSHKYIFHSAHSDAPIVKLLQNPQRCRSSFRKNYKTFKSPFPCNSTRL